MIDTLSPLLWREPLWLWLAGYPWLVWLLRGFLQRPRGRDYADPRLMPWARSRAGRLPRSGRLWRHAAWALAWLLFAMAVAGPRVAENRSGLEPGDYPELMIVLDVSRSMTARDVSPSRLERARLELRDLLARSDRLRIGLVVYAARPHLMVPPTADRSVLEHALGLVRHGLLPTEGSDLAAAMEFAAAGFSPAGSARGLLLVTDGEIPEGDAGPAPGLDDTVTRLARQGIAVHVLGVGTPAGAPLLAPEGGWLHYRGEGVVARLHGERLQRLATLGNGRYATVSATDAEWRNLYDQGIRQLNTVDVGSRDAGLILWRELFGWCLLPAVLLLLLAQLEAGRHSRVTVRLALLAALVLPGLLAPPAARAGSDSQQRRGYQAYNDRSFREAGRAFAQVPGFVGRMGEGASAYRLGDFRRAIGQFTQAALDADHDSQRARAVFNLANCHYQLRAYAVAAELYRESLRYEPTYPAARVNLEYALALQAQQRRAGNAGDGSARAGGGPRPVPVP
ncbi:MAG: VWA domain-containing protein, partial [Gammaproteobacteria bacterium]|nr:VWA domain-containing protein [Gammaproteobacteria bacterium]